MRARTPPAARFRPTPTGARTARASTKQPGGVHAWQPLRPCSAAGAGLYSLSPPVAPQLGQPRPACTGSVGAPGASSPLRRWRSGQCGCLPEGTDRTSTPVEAQKVLGFLSSSCGQRRRVKTGRPAGRRIPAAASAPEGPLTVTAEPGPPALHDACTAPPAGHAARVEKRVVEGLRQLHHAFAARRSYRAWGSSGADRACSP